MFEWIKSRASSATRKPWAKVLTEDGLVLSPIAAGEPLDVPDIAGLVNQLEDEGFAVQKADGWLVSWDSIYALQEHAGYRPAMETLQLPKALDVVPRLESRGTLIDEHFSISVSGWAEGSGQDITGTVLAGAALRAGNTIGLLPKESWILLKEVRAFLGRNIDERKELANRQSWGRIRRTALSARARLDDFLFKTVVLTPDRLTLGLRKTEAGGTKVVEVAPSFEGCPPEWLERFDQLDQVPNRYDLPTKAGIIQILITPQVKTVLQQVKRMPGRRVAGARAEAFVSNPFATLGEDAAAVVDPDEFDASRTAAGLLFERFTAQVAHDALGYPVEVSLLIERTGAGSAPPWSQLRAFTGNDELEHFIRTVRERLDTGRQVCVWEGYELELLGDTPYQLEVLAKALDARKKPQVLVSYARVHDLSAYSSRVDSIGVDKPYYSPFIGRKTEDAGWFPENLVPVIAWTPEGESEPIAVPMTSEVQEQIRAKLAEAEQIGKETLDLSGFPKPMPVSEARSILSAFKAAFTDARVGKFDPTKPRPQQGQRPSLVIKANIQSIDYEEARRDVLLACPANPQLPTSLRDGIQLKNHQLSGLAWLQHLFSKSPTYCRGTTLADDMGLGKTLQLLALMAWAFETNSELEPALVVAPASVLENWEEEVEQFFRVGALPVLTLYGDRIAQYRVPRASIDLQLQQEGLVKFLNPNWRGDSKVVLTTYETLRDLEFSFAAERWSIMVCDEAQKIKNPNAMVTRAAKKQNVRFKIACTGTPVENTLADLWCLFDYVQPGLLGALNDFSRRYRRPIEAETDQEKARVEELRARVKPQLLRRTKAEVAKDLPKKLVVESAGRIPLSLFQRNLYAQSIELFRKRNDPNARVPFKNHLGLLHYLRLICTDPRRYGLDTFKPEPLSEYRTRAPKLDWLLRTLREVESRGEKVIIFCEFRGIQRLLRHYIEETFGFAPDIINGDTAASAAHSRSRQKRLKAFQRAPGFGVIILSPFAIGFGVNIQEANHVIHYTRTWNPAKEDQATDRAYRLGQTRDVYVYYPVVCANDFITFDVKLDQLLQRKRGLAEDMLNGSGDIKPGEFEIDEVVPGGITAINEMPLTLDDVLRMSPAYFECFIAAIWQKKGYKFVERTPVSYDDGVDVVALTQSAGELVQCKSSGVDDTELGWDAIKDVVAGEAAYKARFPDVQFAKACITNQYFNDTAHKHAILNNVALYDQNQVANLLKSFPVTLLDVEKFLVREWDQLDS